jgi:hypothetical protein
MELNESAVMIWRCAVIGVALDGIGSLNRGLGHLGSGHMAQEGQFVGGIESGDLVTLGQGRVVG